MVWPWEQFNWGVFWAIIAGLIVVGILRFLFGLVIGAMDN